MADLEFTVAKRRREAVTFKLGDDHVYTFTPPKSAVMMMPLINPEEGEDTGLAITKSTFDWLGDGLSEEDNQRIQARLKDPEDDLDVDTLSEVVAGLSEKVGGRPTT